MPDLQSWLDAQIGHFVGGSPAVDPAIANDLDIVVLVDKYSELQRLPKEFIEGSDENYTMFLGNKRYVAPGIDLIVTDNYTTFLQWHKAVEICKKLKLTDRTARIAVHHILLERENSYKRPALNAEGDDECFL